MIRWLRKLFAKRDIRIVANNDLNRGNGFWEKHIGMPALVLRTAPDGLLDVQVGNHPIAIEGVKPERFT